MAETICAIAFLVLAIISLVISILSFMEKGFLFNNAYIWASKQERERLNKKPYYRQSAVGFAMAATTCIVMAAEYILQTGWLWIVAVGVCITLLVYAIKSSNQLSEADN